VLYDHRGEPITYASIGTGTRTPSTSQPPQVAEKIEPSFVGQEFATGPTDITGAGKYSLWQQNPDILVQKKGLSIYDDMKNDDMVKAALFVKKFTRLSSQWRVQPASEDKADVDIAEFYEAQLDNMPGTIVKMLMAIMTMLDYGFSVCEKNYYMIKDGQYRGKIGLSSVKSKKPHEFEFKQDEFSNVESLVQNQAGDDVILDPSKFIIAAWMPEWENPYGISDLKAAYIPWWQKDVIMRFHAIFLERFPAPIVIGYYPPGTDQATQDDLLDVLEDLQIQTAAIIPEGITIDFKEVGRVGSEIYSKAIDARDSMIARAILIPELLGFTNRGGTGSYALGKKQIDLFITVLWHLGNTVEELIHEQLTIPFISWNFAPKEFPRFVFEPIADESPEAKAKVIATLAGAGFLDATDPEIREWVGDYMRIMPHTETTAAKMAEEALNFSEPYKFYSPDGRDGWEVEVLENAARLELMDDALAKTT